MDSKEISYKKKGKLATKITIFITIGLFVAFSTLAIFISLRISKLLTHNQESELVLLAEKNAELAKSVLEKIIDKQLVLMESIRSLEDIPSGLQLPVITDLMQRVKNNDSEFISLYLILGKGETIAQNVLQNGLTIDVSGSNINTYETPSQLLSEPVIINVMSSGNMSVLDPYKKVIDGKEYLVISLLQPFKDGNGRTIGVVGTDIDTRLLSNLEYEHGDYESFSNLIICGHETIIVNTIDYSTVGKPFAEGAKSANPEKLLEAARNAQSVKIIDTFKDGTKYHRSAVPFYVGTSKTVWLSVTSISQTEFMAPVVNTVLLMTGIIILFMLILAFFFFVLINKSFKGIGRLEKAAIEISKGNFNVNLSVNSNDEVGRLSEAFINMKDTIQSLLHEINRVSHHLDEGILDDMINNRIFTGDYLAVANSMNSMVQNLIGETLHILETFGEIGKGNFEAKLKQFKNHKSLANQKFDSLMKSISSVNKDISAIIEQASQGKLDERIKPDLYEGDWRKLVVDLNELLDSISAPIDEVNQALNKMSKGEFNGITINNTYRGSFGEMMNSLDTMASTTTSYINEITEILALIADRQLTRTITRDYIGQYGSIKDSINLINKTLRQTISEIKSASKLVKGGSSIIAQTSSSLAGNVASEVSSIQELNEMVTLANEITGVNSKLAQSADEFSKKSMASTHYGNEEMHKCLKSMNDISEAARNISKIIKTIDDIAFQTNILALNAAIEAARAGAHGKGFAVVANEVGVLASKSSDAVRETSLLIESSMSSVNEGTKIVQSMAQALKNIITDSNAVSETIIKIHSKTSEQVETINKIRDNIERISDNVSGNSSISQESAATAQELSSQVVLMDEMISQFRL